MKSLVLFVEGEGDVAAAPILVKNILTDLQAWEYVSLDKRPPFKVGGLSLLMKNGFSKWRNWLRAALNRPSVGGVLLLIDGDSRGDHCAYADARRLAEAAIDAGASTIFSVAVVVACQEYESWFIAGIESLAGKRLLDGQTGIPEGTVPPTEELEVHPRDAKGWINDRMLRKYRETLHQGMLTSMLDVAIVREKMRSFRRLVESAVKELVEAIRSGRHVATPTARE